MLQGRDIWVAYLIQENTVQPHGKHEDSIKKDIHSERMFFLTNGLLQQISSATLIVISCRKTMLRSRERCQSCPKKQSIRAYMTVILHAVEKNPAGLHQSQLRHLQTEQGN